MNIKKVIRTKKQYVTRLIKEYDHYKSNYRKCYILAYDFVLENYKTEGIKMIIASMYKHRQALQDCIGEEYDDQPYYIHAYVEINDICYDPVLEMYFTKKLFYELFNVKVRNGYSPCEAFFTAIKYGGIFFDWTHAKKDRTRECDFYNYPEEFIEWAYKVLYVVFKKFFDNFVQESDELSIKIKALYRLQVKDYINTKYLYEKFLIETAGKRSD